MVRSVFSELLLQDKVVFGGTIELYRVAFSELSWVSQFNRVTALQLFTTQSLYDVPAFLNVTCSAEGPAALIVDRLANANLYDNTYKPSVNAAAALPFHCGATGGCLQALQIHSMEPFPAAEIQGLGIFNKTKTSLELKIRTSDFAFVYCAIVPYTVVPRSVQSIVLVNNVNYTVPMAISNVTTVNEASLAFSGLSPATNYSIYCVTKSLSGSTSSYSDMLSHVIPISTRCCKEISIQLLETTYSAGYKSTRAIRVIFNDAPQSSVSLSLMQQLPVGVNSSSLQPVTRCVFAPVLKLLNTSSVGTANARMLSVQCGNQISTGTYSIVATLKGSSSHEYTIDFPNNNVFRVIDPLTIVTNAPAFKSAIFSRDGGTVVLSFTTTTNKANLADSFVCTRLLAFTGVADATCLWTDARTIVIALFGNNKLNVGSAITLSKTSTSVISNLRVLCPSNVVCLPTLSINPANSILVTIPELPAVPAVFISAPLVVGQCQPFELDFSASSGSAGRPWQRTSVLITSTRNDNISALQADVRAQVVLSDHILVPAYSFQGSRVYTFYVTVCNFFGACGSGRHAVQVTNTSLPLVTIFGPPVVSRLTADPIMFSAGVINAPCAGSNQPAAISDLSLQWRIIEDEVIVNRMGSTSTDPLKFFLSAYLFSVNKQYQVQLIATHRLSLISAQTSVTVIIASGQLVSTIAGGSSRNIGASQRLTLDASLSYDSNLSPTARYNDIYLRYRWSCQGNGLGNNSVCPLSFDSAERTRATLTVVPLRRLVPGSQYIMLVRVTKDTRMSQSSVLLTVQSNDTCSVALISPYTGVVNVNQNIRMSSSVTYSADSSLVWTLNDNSKINLPSVALTATSNNVKPIIKGKSALFSYNLLVNANSFVPGASYSLTLSCRQVFNGKSVVVSSASVDLTMNLPPSSGTFEVLPSRGVALRDVFSFSARNWVDTELPLTYQFGFVSPSNGRTLPMKSQSVISYGQSILPAGIARRGHNISVILTIFDFLAANTSSVQHVTVTDLTSLANVDFASKFRSARNNSEQTKQLVSVYSSSINAVN
eukprot:gene16988-19360_t